MLITMIRQEADPVLIGSFSPFLGTLLTRGPGEFLEIASYIKVHTRKMEAYAEVVGCRTRKCGL